mmetsp:Transcript_16556/g.40770  ORF Transcript_16556/g.40770 Transcript_16556/m.40770 type:complete len:774 (-) Transcript_16556:284-2605(-)|eukprot:CAMPEP_0114522070 /NCGR_PEP_ID=MMETSP0109-20121206/20547_1 /TAXON_ID=29199 /ORGANISM="Chlorarachnion reptans, Strain CCCM449" /LENGTH=773 /DNA_ID=CAMNT_0001703265 /DNA_START=137 /DNA_END=2458 /DNA_ORIENTATION=-
MADSEKDPLKDPKAWKAVLDKKTNRYYYYNKNTATTQWNEPEALKMQRKKSPWRSRVDPNSGRTYYYNKQTKEVSWEKPAAFDGVPAKPTAAKEPAPAEQEEAANSEPAAQDPAPTADTQDSDAPVEKTREAKKVASKPDADGEDEGEGDFQRAAFSDSDDDFEEKQTQKRGSVVQMKGDDEEPDFDENLVESFDKAVEKHSPQNLAAMVQIRFNLIRKKNRGDEDEDSEDETVGAPGYELTKHRKGFLNRVFRLGKAHDADQLLTYKKSLIKKSLLKANRQHDEQAIQMFKNIMSFMGDRKSSKAPAAHARKIIKNALKAPIGMRDEIFLQICKQTHGHPNMAHCLEGWNLMLVCLLAFPPSKNIKVSEYLKKAIQSSTSNDVKERAELARVLLDVIEHQGERQEVPPEVEVEAVRQLKLIELAIRMPDDNTNTNAQIINIKVDPFTTVAEAEQMLFRKVGLQFTQAFGLFEANDERQDILAGSRRVMDVISNWDKTIDDEEVVQDVQKKKKKKKVEEFVVDNKPEYKYLLFQAKLSLHTSGPDRIEDLLRDPKAVNIIYNQAKRDVLQSRIQPEEKDITRLAALKLQVDEGDFMKDIHRVGFLIKNMSRYIPIDLMPKNTRNKNGEAKLRTYEQKIMHKYEKLKGFTPQIAKRNYLDYVERWQSYGAQWFEVEQRKQLKSYPDILNLGISPNGILLQNPEDNEILDTYAYKEVVTWGHSESKFILVVGDVVQQKKLVFKTPKGELMRNLIHSYIHFKVQSRMQAAKLTTDT